MPACYILYSAKLNKYYIGATSTTPPDRLQRHLSAYYDRKYTAITDDWELFLVIDCVNMELAAKIETHIKRMKSKKYIENLVRYPELLEKLIARYS